MRLFNKLGNAGTNMLKMLLAVVVIGSVSSAAFAEGSISKAMQVSLKNGEKHQFLFTDEPVMSFSGSDCVVDSKAATLTFSMPDIEKIIMLEDLGGITDMTDEDLNIDLTNPNIIAVAGLAPGASINVYNIQGTMVASARANADGHAELDITNLPAANVYIVSINNVKNFKLYKK